MLVFDGFFLFVCFFVLFCLFFFVFFFLGGASFARGCKGTNSIINFRTGTLISLSYSTALEARLITRWDARKFARDAYNAGVRYIGGCCGFEPYHIREMAEEVGIKEILKPSASYDADTLRIWLLALSIYRGHFSSYKSRRTPHISPVRARYEASFLCANLAPQSFIISRFYRCDCSSVYTFVSYITTIYSMFLIASLTIRQDRSM